MVTPEVLTVVFSLILLIVLTVPVSFGIVIIASLSRIAGLIALLTYIAIIAIIAAVLL